MRLCFCFVALVCSVSATATSTSRTLALAIRRLSRPCGRRETKKSATSRQHLSPALSRRSKPARASIVARPQPKASSPVGASFIVLPFCALFLFASFNIKANYYQISDPYLSHAAHASSAAATAARWALQQNQLRTFSRSRLRSRRSPSSRGVRAPAGGSGSGQMRLQPRRSAQRCEVEREGELGVSL